ncbi:MAG: O-antigen ligase family protein, partial [Gammaproteobacteria bacterium]
IWLGPSIDGTIAVARSLVIFYATLNIVTTRRRVWGILVLLVALIAIYPGLGAVRYYETGHLKEAGRANWRGVFGNANMTALAMLMHLPFALALYALSRKRQWKWAWAAAAVLLISVTVLTKSRAGFLALLVLGATTFAVSRRKLQAVGALFVAGVLIFTLAPAGFRERIATITASPEEQDGSASSRRIIWGTAIEIALDHPLTGIGVGTYERANAQYAPPELGKAGGQRWKDTHNTYLNIWAEIGTPGLIAFVAMLVTVLTRSRRALRRVPPDDALARFVRAGVTAVWVFAVTGIFNTFHNAWFFYVLVATQLAALRILETEHAARLRASAASEAGGILLPPLPGAPGDARAPGPPVLLGDP